MDATKWERELVGDFLHERSRFGEAKVMRVRTRPRGKPDRSRGHDGRGDLVESPEPAGQARKVMVQIEAPRSPDPIMRRPRADREEKRGPTGARYPGQKVGPARTRSRILTTVTT